MKVLLYFGCIRDGYGSEGHYLWGAHTSPPVRMYFKTGGDREFNGKMVPARFWECIDGVYAPGGGVQGMYRVSQVPPFVIIAWHDRTGDMRPGSNSALIAAGYGYDSEIIKAGKMHFPMVFSRQPEIYPEP